MSTLAEIKAAIDGMNTGFEAWKKTQAEQLDRLTKDSAEVRDRLEELEARAKSPGKTSSGITTKDLEHRELFLKALRGKLVEPSTTMPLRNMEAELRIEAKDVTIDTGAAGGFAVPKLIAQEIGRLELNFSPARRLVRVRQSATSDYHELVSKRGATSGWVGETGTRSATATPTLRDRVPTHGELYAYPQASNWSLGDMFFNVEAWLTEEVAEKFAEQEGIAVISGNGTNRPTGMINTSPATTADFASPERSANAYQAVQSDLTPGGVAILADSLIDLYHTLNASYRSRATWIMNSLTASAIRKLKDTTNQYIWQPGLIAGTPDALLGRPVEIWENMPAIGANNFPVALGDWQRAYVLVDIGQLAITVDPYTNPGFTRFYVRRREGGHVLDSYAAKWIQTL